MRSARKMSGIVDCPRFRLPKDFDATDSSTGTKFIIPGGSLIPGLIRFDDHLVYVSEQLQAQECSPLKVIKVGARQILITEDEAFQLKTPLINRTVEIEDGRKYRIADKDSVIPCGDLTGLNESGPSEKSTGNKDVQRRRAPGKEEGCEKLQNESEDERMPVMKRRKFNEVEVIQKRSHPVKDSKEFEPTDKLIAERFTEEEVGECIIAHQPTKIAIDSAASKSSVITSTQSKKPFSSKDSATSLPSQLSGTLNSSTISKPSMASTPSKDAFASALNPYSSITSQAMTTSPESRPSKPEPPKGTDFEGIMKHISDNWTDLFLKPLSQEMRSCLQLDGQFFKAMDNTRFLKSSLSIIHKLIDGQRPSMEFFRAFAIELEERYPREFRPECKRHIAWRHGNGGKTKRFDLGKRLDQLWYNLYIRKKYQKFCPLDVELVADVPDKAAKVTMTPHRYVIWEKMDKDIIHGDASNFQSDMKFLEETDKDDDPEELSIVFSRTKKTIQRLFCMDGAAVLSFTKFCPAFFCSTRYLQSHFYQLASTDIFKNCRDNFDTLMEVIEVYLENEFAEKIVGVPKGLHYTTVLLLTLANHWQIKNAPPLIRIGENVEKKNEMPILPHIVVFSNGDLSVYMDRIEVFAKLPLADAISCIVALYYCSGNVIYPSSTMDMFLLLQCHFCGLFVEEKFSRSKRVIWFARKKALILKNQLTIGLPKFNVNLQTRT